MVTDNTDDEDLYTPRDIEVDIWDECRYGQVGHAPVRDKIIESLKLILGDSFSCFYDLSFYSVLSFDIDSDEVKAGVYMLRTTLRDAGYSNIKIKLYPAESSQYDYGDFDHAHFGIMGTRKETEKETADRVKKTLKQRENNKKQAEKNKLKKIKEKEQAETNKRKLYEKLKKEFEDG